MEPKFNNAALKCLEALKMIGTIKNPSLAQRRDNAQGFLNQAVKELLFAETLFDEKQAPTSKK